MRVLFFLVALWSFVPQAWGLRLTPLNEAVQRPASGAALDRQGLIDLSLVLSGVNSASLDAYRGVIDRWSQDFRASEAAQLEPGARAEALLQFLHRRLKSYSTNQTRLDVLVDRGTYNCVSSAVAYMILGRDAGLDVQAVATTDHAFALVRLPDREVDVETTTPYGFDPGTKTEFVNSFGQTGFAYVPPGNYTQRKTIGDRQLLGLLVQNRMADLQREGKAEEAVGPAIDRWTFEGTPEAFRTLIDGFSNYGAWLNTRREYAKGLELVDKMVTWTGPVAEAKQLVWAFVNNQVNLLVDKQDYAGAQALTLVWRDRDFLTEAQTSQTLGLVVDRQLTTQARSLPPTVVAEKVEQAFAQGTIKAPRRQELLGFIYGQEVQKVAAAQGPQAAWQYLATLPTDVRGLPTLVKARDVYAYNWSVDVHNRFAKAWNEGRRDDAQALLSEALSQLPDSALLKKDLAMAQSGR